MNAIWALVGMIMGMGLALAATRAPGWVLEHPGTVLAGAAAMIALAATAVTLRMRAFERGHAQRSEAFRLAMLEHHAPELLPGRN